MRRLLPFSFALALVAAPASAWAQVNEAERAVARDLFKQGDELQHQGQLAPALEKFQRAQQAFPAPTNLLRIAQCQAGLGKLVEAMETYRALIRTALPAGSPPAFQSAIDQANNELPQVEPLVPKVTIQVSPASAPGLALQIDGQTVTAALIGTPLPLDPGQHTISVAATDFASSEVRLLLREREVRTLPIALRPLPAAPAAPLPPTPPPAPPAAYNPPPAYVAPPPPVPPEQRAYVPPTAPEKKSYIGFLGGIHFGDELPEGTTPLPAGSSASSDNLGNVSGSGLAFGLDGGFRFGRNWILGVVVEHAQLDKNPQKSDTTMVGASIGIVTNPDRVSFYGCLGIAGRWYNLEYTDPASGSVSSQQYQSADVLLGLGIWIPIGSSIRLVPELTASIGSFTENASVGGTTSSSGTQGHEFYMFGVAGYYNLDL